MTAVVWTTIKIHFKNLLACQGCSRSEPRGHKDGPHGLDVCPYLLTYGCDVLHLKYFKKFYFYGSFISVKSDVSGIVTRNNIVYSSGDFFFI